MRLPQPGSGPGGGSGRSSHAWHADPQGDREMSFFSKQMPQAQARPVAAAVNGAVNGAAATPAAAPRAVVLDGIQERKLSSYTELKVSLHQQLLDMINLSVIDKMPAAEFRSQVGEMVRELLVRENKPLNRQEQVQLVDDILDELLGLGPIEPLLKEIGRANV